MQRGVREEVNSVVASSFSPEETNRSLIFVKILMERLLLKQHLWMMWCIWKYCFCFFLELTCLFTLYITFLRAGQHIDILMIWIYVLSQIMTSVLSCPGLKVLSQWSDFLNIPDCYTCSNTLNPYYWWKISSKALHPHQLTCCMHWGQTWASNQQLKVYIWVRKEQMQYSSAAPECHASITEHQSHFSWSWE